MAKKTKNKSPLLAALLNFFIWGTGYYYIDEKEFSYIFLGAVLVRAVIWGTYHYAFSSPQPLLMALAGIILSIYTGFDAYKATKHKKKPSGLAKKVCIAYLIIAVVLFVLNMALAVVV